MLCGHKRHRANAGRKIGLFPTATLLVTTSPQETSSGSTHVGHETACRPLHAYTLRTADAYRPHHVDRMLVRVHLAGTVPAF